ncbi:MAG TPA: DEAD/DEAH box helicase [Kofleriaceae bacterium]|jgi:superfamily II DNA or RNA helicase|nr:DEAD/DEAH box helicase [Kofleriaceae bacterium]
MSIAAAAARGTPCLRVFADTLFVDDGSRRGDEVRTAMLRLDFDYGGRRVRAVDPRPSSLRDPAAEAQACRVLESFGVVELAQLDDCAVAPGAGVDYIVAIDGDVHALCAFGAYAVPQLRNLGWRVEIDPEYPWQTIGNDAPMYAAAMPEDRRPDWFGIELGVEVDGQRIDLLPALLDLLDTAGDLSALVRPARRCIAVRVDDKRWLPVPPDRLRMLAKVLLELYRDGGKLRAPVLRAPLIADLCGALHDPDRPVRWVGDTRIREQAFAMAMGPRRVARAAPPAELRADLRPYQHDGVAWLQHLRAHDAGGVLADDMGLGKTLQAIAHVLIEKQGGRLDRPAMVVTLTSLVGNWQRELARFAPSLKVCVYHGPDRAQLRGRLAEHDVVITTYPLVARDRDALAGVPLHLLVLDEAHAIKNDGAQTAEAVRRLAARHRVCLSGTPIENHLGELWSLFDFLMPGLLGSRDDFQVSFREPIEARGDKLRIEALRDRVRPYILRRTKDSVARELPAKTQLVRAVSMTGAQRELYESIRLAAHADVRRQIRTRGLAGSTIAILDALLKLRQVCCDPRLVACDAAREVTGSVKLDVLLELIGQGLADGRRILVFSQFARMLGLISEGLLARGIGHVALTGSTPDRQKPIDAFQTGRADVFLISLKAGGAGLNLVGADTVIHYDPWWNPAAQAQATDRAHRIGQTKPVFVHDLIIAGSVEERMLGLQRHKRDLADAILEPAARRSSRLSERDVDDLLAPLTDPLPEA